MANLQNAPGHTNCALNVCIQAWGPNYYVLHNKSLEVQGIHQFPKVLNRMVSVAMVGNLSLPLT